MWPSPFLRTYEVLERRPTLSVLCADKLFHVDSAGCLQGAGAVPRCLGPEAYIIFFFGGGGLFKKTNKKLRIQNSVRK